MKFGGDAFDLVQGKFTAEIVEFTLKIDPERNRQFVRTCMDLIVQKYSIKTSLRGYYYGKDQVNANHNFNLAYDIAEIVFYIVLKEKRRSISVKDLEALIEKTTIENNLPVNFKEVKGNGSKRSRGSKD
jgi:hypothetical protein